MAFYYKYQKTLIKVTLALRDARWQSFPFFWNNRKL